MLELSRVECLLRAGADLSSEMKFVLATISMAVNIIIEVLSSLEDENDNVYNAIAQFESSLSRLVLICVQVVGGLGDSSGEVRWWVKERSLIWFDYYLWHSYEEHRWVQTLRMPKPIFLFIVRSIAPHVSRMDTTFRKAVLVEVWVAVVLYKLATGQNYFNVVEHHFVVFWQFLDLASCYSNGNILRNGNFEDLVGYYPAGVLLKSVEENQKVAVKQWTVKEGEVEIISSRIWGGFTANSMYALHLNTARGPGAVQTKIQSPLVAWATYLLAFDVASPSRGSAVRRLEVTLSSCGESDSKSYIVKSFFFNFVEGNGRPRHITWRSVRWVFTFSGNGHCVILTFRSLTPGSRGIILDNVKLSPTSGAGGEVEQAGMVVDSGSRKWHDSTGKSSLGLLKERVMMTAEIWFRQRFLRRADW